MEKGSRRTAPSATARVKVHSPSLWASRASAPALGLGPHGCHSLATAPKVAGPRGLEAPGVPARQGEEAGEHPAGRELTGRNLRNPVDSSILVIVHCGGEKAEPTELGEAGLPAASLPACSPARSQKTSPRSKCCRNTPRGFGLRSGEMPRSDRCHSNPRLRWDRGSQERPKAMEEQAPGRLNVAANGCPAPAAPALLPAAKSVCFLKWVMMKWQSM